MLKDLLLFRDEKWASIVTYAIIAGLLIGTFYALDYGFGSASQETATVIDKYHADAHTQMIWHSNGKGGGWMQTIYYPEQWGLTMQWHGDNYDFDCSQYWCEASQIGKPQTVTIVKGFFTNDFYSGHILR